MHELSRIRSKLYRHRTVQSLTLFDTGHYCDTFSPTYVHNVPNGTETGTFLGTSSLPSNSAVLEQILTA